jgi:hypothetical protein
MISSLGLSGIAHSCSITSRKVNVKHKQKLFATFRKDAVFSIRQLKQFIETGRGVEMSM